MQISKGVEWACHAVSILMTLPSNKTLRADSLARYYELPSAYMAKQLQALSKAGITQSTRGARGGYRLARPPQDITLWDITAAIEGTKPIFRCTEIRQNGPCPARKESCKTPCAIAKSFAHAETAFREALQAATMIDIAKQFAQDTDVQDIMKASEWIQKEAVQI